METTSSALITNDAVILGLLAVTLGAVFYTSSSPRPAFRTFYKYVPSLLLCYFIPSLFNTFGLIDAEGSRLYYMASRYLLPATLVLLTLSIDLRGILALGPKALVMFLTGTLGIILGGPLAILLFSVVSPETVGGAGPDAVWRGLTTIAGSWIGGGANQAAMKEVFAVSDTVFSSMVAVDILVANVWLAVLLFMASRAEGIDARLGADTSAIDDLRVRVTEFRERHARIPTVADLMILVAIGFGLMGLSHFLADPLAAWFARTMPALERYSLTSPFFWLVVFATTAGLVLSFTRARELEGVGASTLGTGMLYILIATIGMTMDIAAVVERPGLFLLGAVWLGIHALLLLIVGRLIKAPTFYLAVGSQANVGGAASAPVVATAFHPSLAPVGVLLAVLGYAIGTYGAWICGQLMRIVSE
ncbi:MAG TPA: DUF819 family protein [Gemmatimonadaceae bacterium]|nr:DUF819 family protein [Gemmatimonadaceae bacterium]